MPTTATAIAVASGMVRRGLRNSPGDVGDGLPAGERPDEQADREPDARPAVRQERA